MLKLPKQHIFLFKTALLFLFFWASFTLNAQNFLIHKVEEGQTLRDIAKIYQVAPSDIIKVNSELNSGTHLTPGQKLLIPNKEAVVQKKVDSIVLGDKVIDYKYHTVGENETLFSLSKQYNSKIEDIVKLNQVEGYDIKLGQILIIPIFADKNAPKQIDTSKYTFYTVQPKQGKWRVAYDHGITIDELERLNPEIKNETLKIGQKLVVPKFITSKEPVRDNLHFYYHDVQPKETLYSLSKQYNVSIEAIKSANPEILTEGLKFGQTIKIPKKSINTQVADQTGTSDNPEGEKNDGVDKNSNGLETNPFSNIANDVKNIDEVINKPLKINLLDSIRLDRDYHLAILLPFKLKKIHLESEDEEKACQNLTSNKILNYYSGIKLAIDSLKQLGLNVHYDVFDTQASPYVTGKILEITDLSDYDFVIGPIKKDNIDKVAHFLEYDNTPIVVHNYKGENKYRNLIVTTSKIADMQNHMIQYIKENAGGKTVNIIYDPRKKELADTLEVQLGVPVIKIAGKKTKKGYSIYANDIKNAINGNNQNFVILLSDDDSFIFTVLSTLNSINKNHNITLFTLDDKKLYEDAANDRMNIFLSNLNYHFPAKMQRLINPDLARAYKERYNTLPDFVAVNGFDTTFDLLVRAANADNLFEGLQKIGRTEQTSKVYLYRHAPDSGFENQGSIILKISPDLQLQIVE